MLNSLEKCSKTLILLEPKRVVLHYCRHFTFSWPVLAVRSYFSFLSMLCTTRSEFLLLSGNTVTLTLIAKTVIPVTTDGSISN